MKKVMLFLLGALMVSVMPGSGLKAQNVHLNIGVYTLDRTAPVSAAIYAVLPGQNYYYDAAHLMTGWTGSASMVSGSYSSASTLAINSVAGEYYVSGTVDSATFAWSVVVITDAENRCYVLGNTSRQKLDTGYFAPDTLLAAAVDGTYEAAMTPVVTMLGTVKTVVSEDAGFYYSTFDTALVLSSDGAVLTLMDTARLTHPATIDHSLTIRQLGNPVICNFAVVTGGMINIQNANVLWYGNSLPTDFDATAGTGDLFVLNNAQLGLRQVGVSAAGRPVVANNGSMVSIVGTTLGSSASVEALSLNDSSSATISSLTVSTPMFAQLNNGCTGSLTVVESTATANAAGIGADAFYRSGSYRVYYRTLTLAAAVANDTVFLARNTASGTDDTIRGRQVVNLMGDTIMGSLYVEGNTDTVFLMGGCVNYLTGTDAATGTLVIDGLDSVATLAPKNLNVEIRDGRFLVVTPTSGASVSMMGGKYTQKYPDYLASRHAFIANADADNGTFPWKVSEGYKVTFVNYNARIGQPGYADSIAVITTPDNRIVPAPSRPTYVAADTVFSAYYVNSSYTTPWNFLHDVLTSDTTLYAKWYVYNAATDARYTVYHHRQDLNGTYPLTLCDSAYGIATAGASLVVPANIYVGFTPDHAFDTTAVLTDGAIINFYYTRDSFQVTYNLHGGSFAPGIDTVVNYAFGAPVVYPTPVRPGYTHLGWSPRLTTMPAVNFTTNATYSRNSYPLTWSHVDSTAAYTATDITDVYATYRDDNGATVQALLTITELGGATVTAPRNVGVYTYTATPLDTNYLLTGNVQNTLVIVPAGVAVTGVVVETAKAYNGNAIATVTNMGVPGPIYGSDDLQVNTTAHYDNANIGSGKTITASYTLSGADASNYAIVTPVQVLTTSGAIVAPVMLDVTQGNNGIGVSANGYCSGDASGIQYWLTSGNPNQYRLVYDQEALDNGFTNTGWSNITTPGMVDVNVPVNADAKDYTVTLSFRNSTYPQVVSAPITVTFAVNLSRNYTMPIFSDVISIIDTCHCIDQSSVKWYHNGTYVGDGPYYQEVGGLTGSYHATLMMNNKATRTCEQTDLTTLVPEAAAVQTKVTAYPNPVVDRVTLSIENPTAFNHTLRVMNVLGMTLVNTTFDGDETTIDFSGFGIGTYTVSVDGIVVRVIKNK